MIEQFSLVGRFPFGIKCNVISDVVVFYQGHGIRVNHELDSPIFLYKHKDGFFIQVASTVNGSVVMVHENDIELFDDNNKYLDLYEIDVQPIGEKNA